MRSKFTIIRIIVIEPMELITRARIKIGYVFTLSVEKWA